MLVTPLQKFGKYYGLFVEVCVLCVIYGAYQIGYWIAAKTGSRELAIDNAIRLFNFETFFGLSVELSMQKMFLDISSESFIKMVNRFYMYAHVPCTLLFFVWAYRKHPTRYSEIRNGFIVAHIITVAIEVMFPCAPPRMLNELGFVDTIMVYSKTHLLEVEETVKINPYAAMPSIHFGYAATVGVWGCILSEDIKKNLFLLYTWVVFITIIVTGNHFVLDAVVAGIVLLIGYWISKIAKIDQWKVWRLNKKSFNEVFAKIV